MDKEQLDHLKGAVEALLFVSEKPVTVDQLKDAVKGAGAADIKKALAAVKEDLDAAGRGMMVVEIANGWQMLSSSAYAEYIREFYKTRHKERLSRAALETLAIIAYKQPVSRTDVEVIRGVNSDGVVMHLLNKGLIKIAGRKEVPGRPYVYGTTTQFLEFFGLRSLDDLPKLEEFPSLMAKENDVQATPNPEGSSEPLPESEAAPSEDTLEPVGSSEGTESSEADEPEKSTVDQEGPTDEDAQEQLEDELARVRTKLDIEELERDVDESKAFLETEIVGESSGQARVMGEQVDVEGDGPETRTEID